MQGNISQVVSERVESPESKIGHEAQGNERSIDLGWFPDQRFPESAGKNLRQIPPVPYEKILDDESPVIPDEEIAEAVRIEERCEARDQQ